MSFSFKRQAIIAFVGLALLVASLIATAGMGIAGVSQGAATRTSSGSTYVEAAIGAPHFVNPLLATSDTDTDLTHLVFSGLTRVGITGTIVPDMASEWQVQPGGLVYTFTLKTDLKWHDGQPITSDDVVATLGFLRAPDFTGNSVLAARWHDVTVDAPSLYTVRLTLKAPNAAFLQFTTLGILPKHIWGSVKPAEMTASDLNTAPVGSGLWRYSLPVSSGRGKTNGTPVPGEVSASEGVLLEPNPDYPAPNPGIARIWFRLYPTFGAALDGFRLGEVHGLGHIPAERMADVEAISGVTLHKQGMARYTMLLLNVRSPLFDKVETRQAIELAIDKETLVSKALDGLERPLQSPILPESWAYDTSLKARDYNPDRARQLLDSAGWTVGSNGMRVRNGITMTISLAANNESPASVVAARQIASYLQAVGIDAQLALVGRNALLGDYLGPRAFQMVLAGWEASGADPDVFAYWHSSKANIPGGLNFSGWNKEEADRALQAALITQDRAERTKQYLAFQQVFYAEVPSIILYGPLYAYATRTPAQDVTLPHTDMLSPASRFDTLQGWSIFTGR